MNILVSSMLLAFAILMCARSIAGLRPRDKGRGRKRKTGRQRSSREYYKHFDLEATRLEKGKKR